MSRVLLVLALAACADPADRPGRAGPDTTPGTTDPSPIAPAEGMVPIRGGGLTNLPDGRVAAVDVDGDRIALIDPEAPAVDQVFALAEGSEPFRVRGTVDRLFVTLRGTGEVAALDLATGALLWSVDACVEPRGLDLLDGSPVVACHSGEVVVLDPQTGDPIRGTWLGTNRNDLRDVVVDELGDLYLTRFRSARVLRLDPQSLGVLNNWTPGPMTRMNAPFEMVEAHTMIPHLAWKMVARPGGGVLVLHQREDLAPVLIDTNPAGGEPQGPPSYLGAVTELGQEHCAGIAHSTWTEVTRDGPSGFGPVIAPPSLIVDLALSDAGQVLLPSAPPSDQAAAMARILPFDGSAEHPCLSGAPATAAGDGQVVSVAWADERTVLQTRQPFALFVDGRELDLAAAGNEGEHADQLDGWRLYHASTRSGLSCASCHPEGLDDGHTWRFELYGQVHYRRTPAFGGVVLYTAPYHWDAEFEDIRDLVEHVFVDRMGGAPEALGHRTSLLAFMAALQPPERYTADLDPDAIARGEALFHDPGHNCATCHAGPTLTSNKTIDVGTDAAVQVPTLLGVGNRGPWMRTGCAMTLHDRFDPECGGASHGGDLPLTEGEIDDLVAYLRTL